MHRLLFLIALGALTACGPTFEDLPKLSQVEVAQSAEAESAPAVLESGEDVDAEAALPALLGDISAQVQSNSDTKSETPTERPNLLGWLRNRTLDDQEETTVQPPAQATPDEQSSAQAAPVAPPEVAEALDQTAEQPAEVDGPVAAAQTPETQTPETQVDPAQATEQTAQPAPAPASEPVKQASLFGIFRRTTAPKAAAAPTANATPTAPDAETAGEAAPMATAPIQAAAQAPVDETRPSLFGAKRKAAPTGPDKDEIEFGASVPYGTIARLCNAPTRKLGKEVDRYPARGKGYRLYDSNPSATAVRAHYITGFKDGCVRQFAAATATFGTTTGHERVRYMKANKSLPYSATDAAYETLKSKECKVAKNQSCEGRRAEKFREETVFVTSYGRFGGNTRWNDILLHDGQVIEKSYKGR